MTLAESLTDSTLEASRHRLVADAEALAVFALANNNGDLASRWLAWADMVAAAGPEELAVAGGAVVARDRDGGSRDAGRGERVVQHRNQRKGDRTMPLFALPLGFKAKDRITGFVGVITARSQHLTGCNRYWLEPGVGKDGKRLEGAWADEQTLEIIGKTPVFQHPSDAPAGPAAG